MIHMKGNEESEIVHKFFGEMCNTSARSKLGAAGSRGRRLCLARQADTLSEGGLQHAAPVSARRKSYSFSGAIPASNSSGYGSWSIASNTGCEMSHLQSPTQYATLLRP